MDALLQFIRSRCWIREELSALHVQGKMLFWYEELVIYLPSVTASLWLSVFHYFYLLQSSSCCRTSNLKELNFPWSFGLNICVFSIYLFMFLLRVLVPVVGYI